MDFSVSILKPNSPLLEAVIRLGDANKATLGLLPREAFKTHADRGNILVALTPQNQCAGYLLFRIAKTKQRVAITHLCVDENARGYGIAKKLVEELQELSKDWRGISLFSRRGYESNPFWEHMRFLPIGEKPGRGKDKVKLTHYWYDNQHPTLFSLANDQQIESKLVYAIIDANIVYTLYETPDHPLLADWLLDDVFLCTTPEIKNEINRGDDASHRQLMWNYVDNNFPIIKYDSNKFKIAYKLIKGESPLPAFSPQHESDLKQVSFAVAGNAEFFVTQDEQLISNYAKNLSSEFGLRIIRPDDLIVHLDELMNSTKYQQNRLAGSLIKISRVTTGKSDLLAQTFQLQQFEKKAHFANILRQYLAEPLKYETNVVTSPQGDLLALFVYSNIDKSVLEIPILRVVDKTGLSALASHIIFRSVRDAVKDGKELVKVTDQHLSDDVIQGLSGNSFSKQKGSWLKVNFQGILSVKELKEELELKNKHTPDLASMYAELMDNLSVVQRKGQPENLMELERLLWPMKIDHPDIPSFLIPIRANWASDLFDSNLGRQTLLGSDPDLVLKMNNVYYRSAKQKLPTVQSRVLWYVSRGNKKQTYQGDMSIRACSYVDEVIIGTPKSLFKQFNKLGTYDWSQVYETAKKNIDNEILAFRFSRTELFKNPISLSNLQRILNRIGAPQGPMRIEAVQFKHLYKFGIGEEVL